MSQHNDAAASHVRGGILARNTFINLLGLGLPLIVGVFTIRVIIRSMGTERFAILSLIWVVFGYFNFLDLGLGRATTKYAAEAIGRGDHDSIPGFLWTTAAFQAILGLAGGLILILIAPYLVGHILKIPPAFQNEARMTFYIISAAVPITTVSTSFRGLLEAAQRFDLVNAVKIPASTAFYLFPLLGALAGFKLPGIVALLVVVRLLALLAWAYLCKWVIPVFKVRFVFDKKILRPLLEFGGWVTLSSMIWPVICSMDRFFIGSIQSLGAVTYYSAPYEVIARLNIIPGSLSTTLFPAFSSLSGGQRVEAMKAVFCRSIKYLFLISASISVTIIILTPFILKTWLGPDFVKNSTLVFQVLAFSFIVNSISSIPFAYLQAIGRADLPTKVQIAELFIYIPLLWGMVHWLGILGAAIAWTIRIVLDTTLLMVLARKVGRVDISAFAKNGTLLSILVFAAAIAAGSLLALFLPAVVSIIFAAGGLAWGIWKFVLDPGEKKWILSTAGLVHP
jgi:O-antigen/teichoic acid export membrane protein